MDFEVLCCVKLDDFIVLFLEGNDDVNNDSKCWF